MLYRLRGVHRATWKVSTSVFLLASSRSTRALCVVICLLFHEADLMGYAQNRIISYRCCPTGGSCCDQSDGEQARGSPALLVPDLYAQRIACCRPGYYCYSSGCCPTGYIGCEGNSCCPPNENCCNGGGCCRSGYASKRFSAGAVF